MVLYNIPARTGRNVEPETVERLAKVGPVVAVKEASGSLDQVSELLARTDLTILSGDDSLTLPMLSVGAEGVVSVVANLVPKDVGAMVEAYQGGRVDEARRRHARAVPVVARPARASAQPDPGQSGPFDPGPMSRGGPPAPCAPWTRPARASCGPAWSATAS